MFNNNVPSVADIAAVTGNNGNNGFANGDGWWVLIILFALFGGWGNGANGFSGNGCCNSYGAELQRGFDNQTVINKLNGLENGICGLGYDQLNQINGVNTNIMQAAFGLNGTIQQLAVAGMQDTNALSRQLADCCCENRAAIAQVRYDMATDTCAVTNAINQMGQNIIQNDNANYRALHDELVAFQMQAKDEKIADLNAKVTALNLAASQAAQNQYLIQQLRPCPTPAYVVQNPYCCNGYNC